MVRRSITLALMLAPAWAAAAPLDAAQVARIDQIFTRFGSATPGCAVAVAAPGQPALVRAYGMADLEHDVAITPQTIFEAGSVSKQFTAYAVLLLARDGKLSLDDPVRRYLPELPDYGAPLTIRHMLNHTSGLRDWGEVAAIGGWPRTTRAHTQAHMLDIAASQSALNFAPGSQWSYTNTGYNLAALLVERVSGKSFQEFTRSRMFAPLGMVDTSWRDDFHRIVKRRAVAYEEGEAGYASLMPFENVVGNGGLLTTVGDLLKWNAHLDHPDAADAALVAQLQTPGRFNDGRVHSYAFGLGIAKLNGLPMVSHTGATAGYRAALLRLPQQGLSVALLCNADSVNPGQDAIGVAKIALGAALPPEPAPGPAPALTPAEVAALSGMYRDLARGDVLRVEHDKDGWRGGGRRLVVATANELGAADGSRYLFSSGGALRVVDGVGSVRLYDKVAQAHPVAADLAPLVGRYTSADARTEWQAVIEGGALVLRQAPDRVMMAKPLYADAFASDDGTVLFRRDASGRVTGLSVVQGRVWDLRFTKVDVRQ